MLNSEQIQQLQNLVREWQRDYCSTGNDEYDNGCESAKASCVEALNELIESWQQQKLDFVHHVNIQHNPLFREHQIKVSYQNQKGFDSEIRVLIDNGQVNLAATGMLNDQGLSALKLAMQTVEEILKQE